MSYEDFPTKNKNRQNRRKHKANRSAYAKSLEDRKYHQRIIHKDVDVAEALWMEEGLAEYYEQKQLVQERKTTQESTGQEPSNKDFTTDGGQTSEMVEPQRDEGR